MQSHVEAGSSILTPAIVLSLSLSLSLPLSTCFRLHIQLRCIVSLFLLLRFQLNDGVLHVSVYSEVIFSITERALGDAFKS